MRIKGMLILLICVIIGFGCIQPAAVNAAESGPKKVRVGWFESPFNITESNGRRSGYAYEYQQKIAGYTNWEYEYVEGSFPELLEMLKAGDIDLLSDVSYTEQRAAEMLFSSQPMGAEEYYIYIAANGAGIKSGDPSSLKGRKVGINKDSYQEMLFMDWMKKYNVDAKIIELESSHNDSMQMLKDGELDAFVTIDVYTESELFIPAFKIGQSEFFFAVNKSRPDLLAELDPCMGKIRDENRSYNLQLYDKYVRYQGINNYFPAEEVKWISEHGPIRVGYLNDYLPFCGCDPETGALTGALKDYLELASGCAKNAEISFSPVAYSTVEAALDALKAGEVDCVFPVDLSCYDGEKAGVSVTNSFMYSEIYASVRKSTSPGIISEEKLTAAVNKGNLNYEVFLKDSFPEWDVLNCSSLEDSFRSVSRGKADCVLLSNYRIAQTEILREQYELVPVPTGKTIQFSFAVRRNDGELYYILNKTAGLVPSASVQSSLLSWSWPESEFSLTLFLRHNILLIIILVVIIALVIVLLMVRRAERMKRQLEERKKMQSELNAALEEAQAASKAKTLFLNNMSHDIRTPMNAIVGFTALAASHIDNKEQVQDYLKKITISSQHLLSLINDVLDMSRIESGKVTIDEAEIHLPDVIHDLRTIIQANVSSKQLELCIDTQDVVHENIITDRLRLNQVLLNILSNAIKFTPAKGRISFRIIEKASPVEDLASFEFRIKDNGIGMSKEFQKTIFEAFTREKTSTVSGIQGTGLGMAITKTIVDMMGGVISINSEEGKGTEFVVDLPFRISGMSADVKPLPELRNCRALVADDDTDTCLSVCSMLREIGIKPDWTNYGKEAVIRTKDAKEHGEPFSVYIIDWMMPDMNGVETVRRIRKVIGDELPIIILTAYDWADIEEEAREAGVTAFCNKPLFMSELRSALAEPFHKDAHKPEKAPEKVDFSGKRILLTEDNKMNQMIANAILTKSGFEVDIADDGQIAVQKLTDSPAGTYDIILMDIQMPNMDGYEATRRIRALDDKDKANIPIVAVTANAFEEDRQFALKADMNGHLAKPYDIPEMMKTLEQLLGKQKEQ